MACYNLRPKNSLKDITDFEIWWDSNERTRFVLRRNFAIDTHNAYEVSKQYVELQDEFIQELCLLQDVFYDGINNFVEHNIIKCLYPLDTCDTILEKEKKKLYDWFLPKQEEFAERWNLVVNCD